MVVRKGVSMVEKKAVEVVVWTVVMRDFSMVVSMAVMRGLLKAAQKDF